MKSTLNCCKLQVIFKNKRKLSNMLKFKDRVPCNLVSGVVYEYTCGRCNSSFYDETEKHLKIRSGEHIGISPLTFKKTKPSKDSLTCDHLFNVMITFFYEFIILEHGNKTCLLEIKDLLRNCDQVVLKKTLVPLRYIHSTWFNFIG